MVSSRVDALEQRWPAEPSWPPEPASSRRLPMGRASPILSELVERALRSEMLHRSNLISRLLRVLAEDAALSQCYTQYELAERLYGNPMDTERLRAAVRALRGKLRSFAASVEAQDLPWILEIPKRAYGLRLVRRTRDTADEITCPGCRCRIPLPTGDTPVD